MEKGGFGLPFFIWGHESCGFLAWRCKFRVKLKSVIMNLCSLFAASVVCLSASAWAQTPADFNTAMHPEPVSLEEANLSRELGKQPQTYLRGGGTILFQETFANGFDGINGNGAWTVSDNAGDSLWVWVQPGGQGLYADGAATGQRRLKCVTTVGFEPTPLARPAPKAGALDHSATLSASTEYRCFQSHDAE